MTLILTLLLSLIIGVILMKFNCTTPIEEIIEDTPDEPKSPGVKSNEVDLS